jgi:sulfatase maturation enzyme AslB (radical SAM superfamily)
MGTLLSKGLKAVFIEHQLPWRLAKAIEQLDELVNEKILKRKRLKSINLALSTLCDADCIFCPSDRGENIKQKIMPLSYAEKIIDEIASRKFRRRHRVKRVVISEGGEPFLNKDMIEILRLIKSHLPQVLVWINTNFHTVSPDKSRIILEEGLIGHMGCNIDGSNAQNYFLVKKLDYDLVMHNVKEFLRIRNELNSRVGLTVRILSLHKYIHTIHEKLGVYPQKLKDLGLINIPDDTQIIVEQLKKILDMNKDIIYVSGISRWAERDQVDISKIDYKKYHCGMLERIESEAFIAPDGSWYICCDDSKNEVLLGNVITQSIDEVFHSERRKTIIEMLKEQKFEEIGGPCKTVICCCGPIEDMDEKIEGHGS